MLAFARSACNMHTTVAEINTQIESLLNEIDASQSRDLDKVKTAIRTIAVEYKNLEDETRALVKRTAHQGKRIHDAAKRVLRKTTTPVEALCSMDVNFQGLSLELDEVKKKHHSVCLNLKEQAFQAKVAKEKNDERAEKAESLKDDAQLSALLAIPGVSLIGAPIAIAKAFAENDSDDETAVAVLKGAGGAVVGLGLGLALTAISPFLLGYSAVCGARLAALSRSWSQQFKDIEGKIMCVHDIIDDSNQCLSDIKSALRNLKDDMYQWDHTLQKDAVKYVFEDILNSSNELRDACDEYEQNLKSNKKRLHQLTSAS
jgi:hypothetical protein